MQICDIVRAPRTITPKRLLEAQKWIVFDQKPHFLGYLERFGEIVQFTKFDPFGARLTFGRPEQKNPKKGFIIGAFLTYFITNVDAYSCTLAPFVHIEPFVVDTLPIYRELVFVHLAHQHDHLPHL